jgi:hypothetical protein
MKSVFTNPQASPDDNELKKALDSTYPFWQTIVGYVRSRYPMAAEQWSYSKNGGWSFVLKDKKRAIIYLLPRDKYFKVAFVFGQKATDEVLKSPVAEAIKSELESAKVYAEGRGIRIEVKHEIIVGDIEVLINIKLAN